jgi:hypothetical protein
MRYYYATICIKFKVHKVFNIEVLMLKTYSSYYRPEYSTFIIGKKINKIPEQLKKN